MNKEEVLFQKRMQDLARAAYNKGIPVFTDFLSMNEISLLHQVADKLPGITCELYGGYECAERQMAKFAPDALFYEMPYPMILLKIEPSHKKFAEALSHRDYLGSLLGLGVERSKMGDILVREDCAYAYCHEQLASFFMAELTKVRHTFVTVSKCTQNVQLTSSLREQKGTVASLRADAMIAMAYNFSRSQCITLFQSQKVFVNGRLTESNSYLLKEGDIVSVRGHGRFLFEEILSVTKKERMFVRIKKYE